MSFTRESAVKHAKTDLAARLSVSEDEIVEDGVSDADFPDMSLGAPLAGEMSAQMIASGWRISLSNRGKAYEYRADKFQLRLHNFEGRNYVIGS